MTFIKFFNFPCSFCAFVLSCHLLLIGLAECAPAANEREKKDVMLLPAVRYIFVPTIINPSGAGQQQSLPAFYQQSLNQQQTNQLRGPFDFIGNWIQGSDWFPIQINVPDTVSNISSNVQNASAGVTQWTQDVGSGLSQWTQNAQNGFAQFTQNAQNGISQFGQNFAQLPQNAQNGFNQFTTNVGNNWNQLTSNLGNRFPQISQATQNFANGVNQVTSNVGNGWNQVTGNLGNWVQTVGQRIPIVGQFVQNNRVPVQGQTPQNVVLVVPSEGDLLETFP